MIFAILKNKKIKSLVIIVVGGLSSQVYVISPLKFQAQTLRAYETRKGQIPNPLDKSVLKLD